MLYTADSAIIVYKRGSLNILMFILWGENKICNFTELLACLTYMYSNLNNNTINTGWWDWYKYE